MALKKNQLLLAGAVIALTGLGAFRLNSYLQPPTITVQERVISVSAITVEPQPLTAWVFAEGTAEAQRKAFLNFERAGKVVAIGDDDSSLMLREGSRVNKNRRLASLDSRTNSATVDSLTARLQSARKRSEEARANTLRAHNDLKLAQIAFERTQKIHKDGLISQDALDRDRTALLNAEAAVTAADSAEASAHAEIKSISAEREGALVTLSKDNLFAPFDGLITVMNLREGNYYYPPQGITRNSEREASSAIVVVDDNHFEITLQIPETSAAMVEEGETVWISANSTALYQSARTGELTGGIMIGKVWSVSPALSLQNRSRTVKVRTDIGQDTSIHDGLFVQAWIAARHKSDAISLPIESLSFRDRQPFIYVIEENRRVTRRMVKTGLEGLGRIEITSGLSAGDQVVVRGQHLLADGSLVQVVGHKATGGKQ
ncbi:efflux RND transporter periplasmic adaptor subunit [Sansalvadorimonas verongulae]|uniref:efflux RND transporter periplasmic adaptor subunit n=1 Tax=Sansalvadorimonas verongulae TaxID=2172824 RepID=UPI0012BCFF9A|nr:efflux RND transporter periplasmic adaptor subunit [Sansalvadorimonas verongulae]MTI12287.1 efflux RND transporter periplasmic adaptor subunit [Sansalvadorimonas verongulae]